MMRLSASRWLPDLHRRSVLVPLIIACALLMENLDGTVITTALPAIAASLHAPVLHLSLTITGYLLSLAVFIPISGWMADRYGAKRIFRLAIGLFTLSSLLCASAQTLPELVGARVLQGVGGAMMVPVGRLVLLRSVPKTELVAAMSYMTVPALLGPIVGPPLGGFLATYGSWRWIFVINLPIGLLGLWLTTRYIDEIRDRRAPSLDARGWLLVSVGLAGLVVGFENLGKGLIPTSVLLAAIGIGGTALLVYTRYARHHRGAIIDLRLLRVPTFAVSIGGGALYRVATGAYTLLLPLMFQLGFGYTAAQSGLITFSMALGALLMKTTAPRLLMHWGFRQLLIVNTLLCALLLAAFGGFRPWMPHAFIIAVLLVGGFLSSLQFTCFNTMAFADLRESQMSHGTSFSSTAQQVALSLGVGLAAQALSLLQRLRGEPALQLGDFTIAFILVGLVAASAVPLFRSLPPDAGDSVSGHPTARPQAAEAPARP